MARIDRAAVQELLSENLETLLEALGLTYHPYSQSVSGKIDPKFTTGYDIATEVTKISKTVYDRKNLPAGVYIGRTYSGDCNHHQEATLLGKVNAIAEFLGVEFDVKPEHIIAEKVKAVRKAKK